MSENVPTEPECPQEEVVIETKITDAAAEPFNFVEPEKPNRRNGNKIRNEESNRNKPEETKLGKAKKKKYVLKRKKPKSSSQSDSDASVKSEGSVKGRVKADSKVSVQADVTAEEVKPHEVADDASKEIKTPYKSSNIGNNLDKSPSEVEYPLGDKSILAESAPKIKNPTESKLVSRKGTDESENRQEDESINAPVCR